jgi:hypothetical protein
VADAYASLAALDDARAEAVIASLERLGAQAAADEACNAYIAEANATASAYGLDRDGRLGSIFEATARRLT